MRHSNVGIQRSKYHEGSMGTGEGVKQEQSNSI